MNLGNFTVQPRFSNWRSSLAFNAQNPNIETEHVLKALLDQEDLLLNIY
jgi:ATP-dependent Clp protease ATP-binding subunit ClpB